MVMKALNRWPVQLLLPYFNGIEMVETEASCKSRNHFIYQYTTRCFVCMLTFYDVTAHYICQDLPALKFAVACIMFVRAVLASEGWKCSRAESAC